jgi:hypothetical protein
MLPDLTQVEVIAELRVVTRRPGPVRNQTERFGEALKS